MLAASAPPVIATWFHIVCGVWLVVAPFALQYRAVSRAVVDDVAVGIVVLSAIEPHGLLRAPIGAA
ncbi:MAG: hypothetical protein A3G76_05860 [Acidobacteria bacterium RIFCSPLOWO2_12_FULL_65_11]|nr:MAG: hypothetical protein A3H95_13390 [Acidobacteria bacterium RIFCSPLOWO2_02_FULL_64_15]OFW31231.1 MAG: hypothetical protein A3G76_05860 [Acidobacteria bacterium RIFCSPLOWO2_12_FULL_65_11]